MMALTPFPDSDHKAAAIENYIHGYDMRMSTISLLYDNSHMSLEKIVGN